MSELLLKHFDLLAQAPDGVARLRELILTLAVQGKLVPQDPTDEPASVLLQRIRAEKDRLIAEGKIKRDKPLPPNTDEEKPFELPQGWNWVPLQHVGFTQTGTTPDKKNPEFYGTDIPFIKPGDIYHDRIDYENEGLTNLGLADSGRLAPAGSVLMVCIGTIGKSNLCLRDCSFNQQINSVTPLCCSPEYINLYLRSPTFQSEAWAQSSSTTISILNKGKWEAIPIALPPLQEQLRIVARVEELMRLCDALEAKQQLDTTQHAQLVQTLLGTLTDSTTPDELATAWQRVASHFDLLLDRPEAVDALEQLILQLAVRGLLVPQDPTDEPASVLLQRIRAEKDRLIAEGKIKRDKPLPPVTDEEKPFELPQGWEWARLQHAFDVRDGTHDTPKYHSSGYPLVTSKNLYGGLLDLTDVKLISPADHEQISARSKVDRNDILFAMIGSIGNPVLVDTDVEFSVKNVALFKYYALALSNPKYLLLVLQSEAAGMKQRAAGGVQSFISLGQLRSSVIALPPLTEQSRVVARVEELRQLCHDLRQRLTTSRTTQAHLADALVEAVATA